MDKQKKMFSKGDLILIVAILVVAVGILLYRKFFVGTGLTVVVTVDGEEVKSWSLDENVRYDVSTDGGHNVVLIEDGKAFVEDADCRDHICVDHKPINKIGETIICLPHKLVVEVKE